MQKRTKEEASPDGNLSFPGWLNARPLLRYFREEIYPFSLSFPLFFVPRAFFIAKVSAPCKARGTLCGLCRRRATQKDSAIHFGTMGLAADVLSLSLASTKRGEKLYNLGKIAPSSKCQLPDTASPPPKLSPSFLAPQPPLEATVKAEFDIPATEKKFFPPPPQRKKEDTNCYFRENSH